MLPDDDSIEIIDQNNNEGESSKKPNEEEDDHNNSVEILPEYQVMDEQNVRELKILLYKDGVAVRLLTMDVPFLCNEYDILATIFPSYEISKDELGFRVVEDGVVKKVEINAVNDPKRSYQYTIKTEALTIKRKSSESFKDCYVEEKSETSFLSTERPPQCSTPKSTDSQETYFEAEMKVDLLEDENFYSCLDDENDIIVEKNDKFFACSDNAMKIDVKKNDENRDALFVILHEHEQDKHLGEDDKETVRESSVAEHSHEDFGTSRFYTSSTKWKEQRSSSLSQKTVQLSDSPILSRRNSSSSLKSLRDTILAVYPPPPARGGITIYKENYKCLGDSEYLNDVIIDFYLKYLTIEVLKEEDRSRTHVFSSQFFTRLSKPPDTNSDAEVVMPESERRHIGVERWTKNVNIFEKDFVVIPINEHFHWNLAIICYPGLVGIMDDGPQSLIRPCILFFDSLSNKSKDRIAAILRGYLTQEYLAKMGEEKNFSKSVLKIIYPKVPKQSNATDCGLYVLQYVEQFFKNPIIDFTMPLDLSQWFKHNVIKQKRAQIANLIAELSKNYNPDKNVSMPVLQFPSDSVSSDEEDLYCPSIKRKNPLFKENYPNFITNSKINSDAESCSLAVLKKKGSNQSSLDRWSDVVRDEPSSSDQFDLSLDFKAFKNQVSRNDYLINSEEDDIVMEEYNVSAKCGDKSLEIVSDIQLPKESSSLSKSVHHSYSYRHKKISLIKENFSGLKSHIFQKTSIFSDEVGEQSSSGTRPKRECRTKGRSEKMVELVKKYQERKKKSELKMGRCASEEHKKSNNWIDTSDFNSTKPYSFYNIDKEQGIPPSTSYSTFKINKKHSETLEQLLSTKNKDDSVDH